jgi:hypothetical protein
MPDESIEDLDRYKLNRSKEDGELRFSLNMFDVITMLKKMYDNNDEEGIITLATDHHYVLYRYKDYASSEIHAIPISDIEEMRVHKDAVQFFDRMAGIADLLINSGLDFGSAKAVEDLTLGFAVGEIKEFYRKALHYTPEEKAHPMFNRESDWIAYKKADAASGKYILN